MWWMCLKRSRVLEGLSIGGLKWRAFIRDLFDALVDTIYKYLLDTYRELLRQTLSLLSGANPSGDAPPFDYWSDNM